jgi:hypothetical protein
MALATYYVTLPFIASDDGVAAGEATECFNLNAVMRAGALPDRRPRRRGRVQPHWRSCYRQNSATPR